MKVQTKENDNCQNIVCMFSDQIPLLQRFCYFRLLNQIQKYHQTDVYTSKNGKMALKFDKMLSNVTRSTLYMHLLRCVYIRLIGDPQAIKVGR